MCKELFIEAHEDLVALVMEAHPEMDEAKAYDMTADAAYGVMVDRMADAADRARDGRQKPT